MLSRISHLAVCRLLAPIFNHQLNRLSNVNIASDLRVREPAHGTVVGVYWHAVIPSERCRLFRHDQAQVFLRLPNCLRRRCGFEEACNLNWIQLAGIISLPENLVEIFADLLQLHRSLVEVLDRLFVAIAEETKESFGQFRPDSLFGAFERGSQENSAACVGHNFLSLFV